MHGQPPRHAMQCHERQLNDMMSFTVKLRVSDVLSNVGTGSGTDLTTKSALFVTNQELSMLKELTFTIVEPQLKVLVTQTFPVGGARVDGRDDVTLHARVDHRERGRRVPRGSLLPQPVSREWERWRGDTVLT